MKYDEKGECYIAESKEDFKGWEYLGKTKHKDGVYIVSIRNSSVPPAEFRKVVTSEEHLPIVSEEEI